MGTVLLDNLQNGHRETGELVHDAISGVYQVDDTYGLNSFM